MEPQRSGGLKIPRLFLLFSVSPCLRGAKVLSFGFWFSCCRASKMTAMTERRAPLADQHFDVLVIGGGINGIALAGECALAGGRVLVVDQNDFGSGTTSRSTRIIHGGLRYLEYGEIGLVRESLRERDRLLRQSPHLVRPLRFLLALDARQTSLTRAGMAGRTRLWVYPPWAGRPWPTPRTSHQF